MTEPYVWTIEDARRNHEEVGRDGEYWEWPHREAHEDRGHLLAIASAASDLDAAIGETADDVPGRARPALLALRVALAGTR